MYKNALSTHAARLRSCCCARPQTSRETPLTLFASTVTQTRRFRGRGQGRASTNPAGRKLARSFTMAGGRVWLADVERGRALRQVDLDFQAIGGVMRKPYESPRLVVYGPIA